MHTLSSGAKILKIG